jgi:hypothetical protein
VLLDIGTEQRWSDRKIFKVKAVLTMQDARPVPARTFDIGGNGMSLSMPFPLSNGSKGVIQFDLLQDGQVKPMKAAGTVVYCIYSNGEFKVGFKFKQLDLLVLTAITRFVR